MARHALHGDLTTFYWGQSYGGPQEAWLTVPVFRLFGSSWPALRIVPIALTVVSALLLWRVGRRIMSERAAVASAALLGLAAVRRLRVGAPARLLRDQRPVLGPAASPFAAARGTSSRPRVATFGFVLGLALWQSVQLVTVAIGMIVWIVWKRPTVLRHCGLRQPPPSSVRSRGSFGS